MKLDEKALAELRTNPNPKLVGLINFAIEEITAHLPMQDEYRDWLDWAAMWKAGRRSPQACVDVAHGCFKHKGPVMFCLGQLAWGAKEACYSTPTSGWLVVRYIADAMVSFGIAFPEKAANLLEPPAIEETAREVRSIPSSDS